MTDIVALIFILSFIAAQLAVSKSFDLFRHNFLVDEILTFEIATTRNLSTAIRAITSGLDTNPPIFHLFLRVFRIFILKNTELVLRCIAFLSLQIGIVGIYFFIRMIYPWHIALLTTLIVFNHTRILRHSFYFRMYGLWFTSTVWFAYFLSISWNLPQSLLTLILLAFLSLLACMMHTFGIVPLSLIIGVQALVHGLEYSNWPVCLAACFGPMVFLFWIPIFWKQNAAWIAAYTKPASKEGIVYFLNNLLFPKNLKVLFLVAGLSCFLLNFGPPKTISEISLNVAPLAGLASLALMPGTLIIISLITSEPILAVKYGLPAVAGIAPFIAVALTLVPYPGFFVIGLLTFFIGIISLHRFASRMRTRDQKTAELVLAIRNNTGREPILFESHNEIFAIYRYAPDLSVRCFAIDFETTDELGYIDNSRLSSRDTIRIFSKHFNGPHQIPWITIRRFSKHFIVPSQQTLHQGFSDSRNRYPGFLAHQVEAGLYYLVAY